MTSTREPIVLETLVGSIQKIEDGPRTKKFLRRTHVKAKAVVMGPQAIDQLFLRHGQRFGSLTKVVPKILPNLLLGVSQKGTVRRRQCDVNEIVELRENARATEFCNARQKEKTQRTHIAFQRQKEPSHLRANGFEKFRIVQTDRQRRVVFVDQKNKRQRRQFSHPIVQISEIVGRAFRLKSHSREPFADVTAKLIGKILNIFKFFQTRKIQVHNVIDLVRPKRFDGKSPEVPQPKLE